MNLTRPPSKARRIRVLHFVFAPISGSVSNDFNKNGGSLLTIFCCAPTLKQERLSYFVLLRFMRLQAALAYRTSVLAQRATAIYRTEPN